MNKATAALAAYLDAKAMERVSILAPEENDFVESLPTERLSTLCWRCNKHYAYRDKTCPKCHAINANIDPLGATRQLNEEDTP